VIKYDEDKRLVMELPWETVELIVRDALKDDIRLCSDPELLDALTRVYEYYGGLL
jgi:hypothetical protein